MSDDFNQDQDGYQPIKPMGFFKGKKVGKDYNVSIDFEPVNGEETKGGSGDSNRGSNIPSKKPKGFFWIPFLIFMIISIFFFAFSSVSILGWVLLVVLVVIIWIMRISLFKTGLIKSIFIWILMFIIATIIYGVTVSSTPKNEENANVNTNTTQTTNTTQPTSTPYVAVDTDLGMYEGKVYKVNQTKSTNPNFNVTLKQVLIGDKDFGRAKDGTWLVKSFADSKMNEVKFAIVDYTIKAKKDLDLVSINFDITWSGGEYNGGLFSGGAGNAVGAERFGFYPQFSSLKIKAGETKKIKVRYVLTNQLLTGEKIFFQLMNSSYDERVEFEITNMVK